MATTTLPLKLYFTPTGLIRRVNVKTSTSFAEFEKKIGDAWNRCITYWGSRHLAEMFFIQYRDEEGDWICISSEEEWQNAIQSYRSIQYSSNSTPFLRIKIRVKVRKLKEMANQIPKKSSINQAENNSPAEKDTQMKVLDALDTLGFKDRQLNQYLLTNIGSLQQSIPALLNLYNNS